MMPDLKLFAVENLRDSATRPCAPWEFVPKVPVSEHVRNDKQARQDWYRNRSTAHQFYSGFEGINSGARVTGHRGDNPPQYIRAVIGDYDLKLGQSEILAGVSRMGSLKPNWLEHSLGGNFRLVWLLETPVLVSSLEFATAILRKLLSYLPLGRLPGLDEPAFLDPTRLYCNGGAWTDLQNPTLSPAEMHGVLVEVGREFSFRGRTGGIEIPLETVEEALKKAYENFSWPSEFTAGSQGPSFWIPASASAMSAIVKSGGFITFSAHAEKIFYSWKDLLGAEFVKRYETESIGEAVEDIWFDGEKYWRINPGEKVYKSERREDIHAHLTTNCKLSQKGDDSGASPLAKAMQHIRDFKRVEGAGSFVLRSPGMIVFNDRRWLNNWSGHVIPPADETVLWTPDDFPFLHPWLTALLVSEEQLEWTLSFLSWFYRHAVDGNPTPGQALFMMGAPSRGKTLFAREVVGRLAGGFADAGTFFLQNDAFNADLYLAPVWTVDDEITSSEAQRRRFQALLKKVVANSEHRSNQKFHTAALVEWCGRVIVSLNADEISMRTLVPTESGILNKLSFLRCSNEQEFKFTFPSRMEVKSNLARELPKLGRFLLDWKIPERWRGDNRYGVVHFFDREMQDKANQSSQSAGFFELLLDFLTDYFHSYPDATEWSGTTTALLKELSADPRNTELLRGSRPELVSNLLAGIMSARRIQMRAITSAAGTRIWSIPKAALFDLTAGDSGSSFDTTKRKQ